MDVVDEVMTNAMICALHFRLPVQLTVQFSSNNAYTMHTKCVSHEAFEQTLQDLAAFAVNLTIYLAIGAQYTRYRPRGLSSQNITLAKIIGIVSALAYYIVKREVGKQHELSSSDTKKIWEEFVQSDYAQLFDLHRLQEKRRGLVWSSRMGPLYSGLRWGT